MASHNREPEQPNKNLGYEAFKTVAWFGAAIFAGSVILRSLGIGNFHGPKF